jgi:hypothetical protein
VITYVEEATLNACSEWLGAQEEIKKTNSESPGFLSAVDQRLIYK